MRILLCIILLAVVLNASGQKLSKKAVVDDLEFLVQSVEQYNPALRTYNPDFQEQATALIATVNDSLPLLTYFGLVSQIATFSEEGHFKTGNWEDTVHKGFLDDTYHYLPLSVEVTASQIFVRGVFTEAPVLEFGDEVLSINGVPSAQILEQLYNYIPSDGHIVTYKEKQLSKGFYWMYYLFIDQPAAFEITYKSYTTGKVEKVTLNAINRSQKAANYRKNYQDIIAQQKAPGINDFYELEVNEKYVLLKLKSFDVGKIKTYRLKAKKFYAGIFKEVAASGTQNLVIDLRNNTGGRNEFADAVVPYLLKMEGDSFLKKTISWSGKEKVYQFPKKKKRSFQGKIYTLTNGSTFSAAASLARYTKEYGNATVIGEETGTRYEGFAAGSTQIVYLPHSGIRIGIPRYHILFPRSQKQTTTNRGMLPDITVQNNIVDLKEKTDRVLNRAVELMNE